jgi:hypothetical protein
LLRFAKPKMLSRVFIAKATPSEIAWPMRR